MTNTVLDELDLQILTLLQRDAKLSVKELAHKLKKAMNTIYDRVNRLKTEGYIRGTMTLINHQKIGDLLICYTQVQLQTHTQEALKEFQAEVAKFRQVLECHHMTGAFDFLLKIVVKSMSSYNEFLLEHISGLKNVGSLQSYFVINETKRDLAYPIYI